ncbi:MAG: YceI family protein, partial [Wenzhouxiangellaceae bacterium]
DWMPVVTARIRLRDVVREVDVPVAVVRSGERLQAIGRFELLQSDFGIEPFSAAGGALRVSDRMQLRFRIAAQAGSTRNAEITPACVDDVAMMRDSSTVPQPSRD